MPGLSYEDFLAQKRFAPQFSGINDHGAFHESLFPFQRDMVSWALRVGRAAIFADCGLGKARMAIEWGNEVARHTGQRVLIFAPLAVTYQFATEAERVGKRMTVCRDGSDVTDGLNVTNYERSHRFSAADFGGVVLDESSVLKHHDSKTRGRMVNDWGRVPFRLCCTATPSPNDHMELGNHSEFLGTMTMSEMLSMFFVHDGGSTQNWRLKGHAKDDFWAWVCSWAINMRMPSDLGYSDDGFVLPQMHVHSHVVPNSDDIAKEAGLLFSFDSARTLHEQRAARRESINRRVKIASDLANDSSDPWLVWCDLNDESSALASAIPDSVEVRGSDSLEEKERRLMAFVNGEARVLVSKPTIAGWGLNLQHCAHVAYVGVSHSAEAWYQSVRRVYRFGQKREVHCHVITSEAEGEVVKNLHRKLALAEEMAKGMVENTKNLTRQQLVADQLNRSAEYKPEDTIMMPEWIGESVEGVSVNRMDITDSAATYHGDSVEVMRAIPDDSIHYSVYSPPFADLYVYSNSERDLGNCRNEGEFHEHLGFIVDQLIRITKPGRLTSFHCMNLPTSKSRDGYIGIRDFRGSLIRLFLARGWIYHSEVVIWKDPVTAMQRTKALGLLHKQIRKDSTMCRQGIPDYLVTMRKPGDNDERVGHTAEEFPVERWQRYASPIWMDINPNETLQHRSAREHEDERHICPLQLEVIRRAVELWTAPGDIVFSPFMGIGSEGYVAISEGRRFIGIELKESYYRQAVKNIAGASKQGSLFQ